jgi:CRP-like cAMP-binding protein
MVEISDLRKYSLFGGLLEDQIEKMLPLLKHETYAAGQNIIVEGEQNDRIRFIISGRVAVVKNGIILMEFKEGDTVGEMEVLDMMPSVATVQALSPVEVTSLSNKVLHEVYKSDIKAFSLIVMNLARDLSRRLRHLDEIATDSTGETFQHSEYFIS